MYHSITIGDKNTYDDWHLVPTSRPVFNPPTLKTKTVDIPGADGVLDFSTSLTKYPVFNNRTGSIEFAVLNDKEDWYILYSKILSYVQGKTLRAILEDDPDWMYEGRFSLNQWNSNNNGTWSTIVLDYDLKPYKMALQSTCEDWLWDPFDFRTGIIATGLCKDVVVDSDDYVTNDFSEIVDMRPVVPMFTVTTENGNKLYAKLWNSDLDIDGLEFELEPGTYQLSDFILSKMSEDSIVKIGLKGHGTISIDYRNGRL